MSKKYKALICDVDGTLVSYTHGSLPTKKISKAIELASQRLHVGVATSRPFVIAKPILDHLLLTGPSIVEGGSQIIDPKTNEVFWEQPMNNSDVHKIAKIVSKYPEAKMIVSENGIDEHYDFHSSFKKPFQIWINKLTLRDADRFINEVSHIPTITVLKIPDGVSPMVHLGISHAKATKQHGIFEVAKILGIETSEIIGVGDGYNDFPLLMACGLKVAMGNAVDDLKAIADYIAPSVDEDGVSDVIEKFILNTTKKERKLKN